MIRQSLKTDLIIDSPEEEPLRQRVKELEQEKFELIKGSTIDSKKYATVEIESEISKDKNLLTTLNRSISGGLGSGNLGVVMARAGVGKKARGAGKELFART